MDVDADEPTAFYSRKEEQASSPQDAEVMELLQLQSDQGPCPECCCTGAPVSVPDLMGVSGRWLLSSSGNLTMDAAFDRLRCHARIHDAQLSEVARQVVESDLAGEVLDTYRGTSSSRPALVPPLSPSRTSAQL